MSDIIAQKGVSMYSQLTYRQLVRLLNDGSMPKLLPLPSRYTTHPRDRVKFKRITRKYINNKK